MLIKFLINNSSYRTILLSFISGFCGNFSCDFRILSYHFVPIFIIISLLIFISAKNRLQLIVFITCYHSMSARSLILGYSTFFKSSFLSGILLVTLASSIFSCIVTLLSFNKNKFVQLLLINIFWCFPIFLIGWAAPLFATGYFMPGLGWCGLILFVPIVYGIYKSQLKYKFVFLFIIFCFTFINIKNNKSNLVTSINTSFHNNLIKDTYQIYKKISSTFQILSKKSSNINIALFPEDALPCFNKNIETISIREMKKNSTSFVLTGATTCFDKNPQSGIVFLDKDIAEFIYIQRQPMPYAMYVPFTTSYNTNWLNNGIFKFHGKKYGLFVCFETVVLWTYIQTFFYKPDMLLSFNSVYWDNSGKVQNIQDQLMFSMARLFNIPYQGVWNY